MRTQDALPAYLQRYVVPQRYDRYTPVEHATWRYIMRRARNFFSRHAVPSYAEGISKTGIPMDRIPKIDEIDVQLQKFGWGAVGVCGFIPPAAFLDFQARSIMPIAMDMRTLEHLSYTPAPDIVHEAAGHIPILYDPAYRKYLQRYANMANKSIISSEDVRLYEAIRWLSDIKENPDATQTQIDHAGAMLKQAYEGITHTSEMTKVGRMAWWTAEYGLVGDLKNPKIYGAGLLSSVGESEQCLTDKVRKIRLTVDCVQTGYDITEPQPQLFVAESIEELPDVLEQLECTLSFRRGGAVGMNEALLAKSVNTVFLDSGASASGVIECFESDASQKTQAGGRVDFIKFNGPVQIAHNAKQLPGQGRERHGEGFSSPVGFFVFAPSKPPHLLHDDELRAAGIVVGVRSCLDFVSGFKVQGMLKRVVRVGNAIAYMTFDDCTVTRGSRRYYEPAWGEFDLLVGASVASVHGGPAERQTYGDYELGQVSSSPGRTSAFSDHEQKMFRAYTTIREVRQRHIGTHQAGKSALPVADVVSRDAMQLASLADAVLKNDQGEWLVGLELLELAGQCHHLGASWVGPLREAITSHAKVKGDLAQELLTRGIELLAVAD